MNNLLYSIIGILIPFIGTSLGSFFVFFLKNKINTLLEKIMIGFAIGVMLAASVWSLIIPSINLVNKQNFIGCLPTSVGLLLGVFFLIIINYYVNKIKLYNCDKKFNMLLFSVTLHNIPEGMAVGVCFAGFLSNNANIMLAEAMLLAIGIAIQNIPEGAIISMPLKINGYSKIKAFLYGVLSGVVEPLAAIITILLLNIVVPILPYLLSFAAGAMIYVVIEELVPEMHSKVNSSWGIIGVIIGFIIMMSLDVLFS